MTTSLGLRWLQKRIEEFGEGRAPYQIAALLHIYLGTLSIEEIAALSGIGTEGIMILRSNGAFMKLVDASKQECAKWSREDLILKDRAVKEYDSLAADYSMLEEVLRMQTKIPLFAELREVAQSIKSKSAYGLATDPYNLRLFRNLYLFFLFSEKYLSTLTSRSLPDLTKIAEETVWPALAFDEEELEEQLGVAVSITERVAAFKEELKSLMPRNSH
jgi:hypothetical protein